MRHTRGHLVIIACLGIIDALYCVQSYSISLPTRSIPSNHNVHFSIHLTSSFPIFVPKSPFHLSRIEDIVCHHHVVSFTQIAVFQVITEHITCHHVRLSSQQGSTSIGKYLIPIYDKIFGSAWRPHAHPFVPADGHAIQRKRACIHGDTVTFASTCVSAKCATIEYCAPTHNHKGIVRAW